MGNLLKIFYIRSFLVTNYKKLIIRNLKIHINRFFIHIFNFMKKKTKKCKISVCHSLVDVVVSCSQLRIADSYRELPHFRTACTTCTISSRVRMHGSVGFLSAPIGTWSIYIFTPSQITGTLSTWVRIYSSYCIPIVFYTNMYTSCKWVKRKMLNLDDTVAEYIRWRS